MRLPNNSDTACLIKADWLEDHGLVAEAQGLREDVTEGPSIGWIGRDLGSYVADVGGVGGDVGVLGGVGGVGDVGGLDNYVDSVGGVNDVSGFIGGDFGVGFGDVGGGGIGVGIGGIFDRVDFDRLR